MNIREYFLENEKNLQADENYVSDGFIAINKKFVNSKLLEQFKTVGVNLLTRIPYDKGEDFELPDRVELFPNNKLAFPYSEEFYFDYNFVKIIKESFFNTAQTIVFANYGGVEQAPIMKFWDEDDEFIGCLSMSIKKR